MAIIQIVLLCLLTCLSAILFIKLLNSHKELIKSHERRYNSYMLANQLRQESDDLTRMARTYVVTSDQWFLNSFWEIKAIRDGIKPRPLSYNRVFWNFLDVSREKDSLLKGEQLSLNEMMKRANLNDKEHELLSEAQKRSDELIKLEVKAFAKLEGEYFEENGVISKRKDKADRENAIKILFNDEYHFHKKEIMKPINEFYESIDARTKREVAQNNTLVRYHLRILVISFVLTAFMALMVVITIRRYHRIQVSALKYNLNKAEESDRLKSIFLKVISHELRTPLNSVIGFSDLITCDMSCDKLIDFTSRINKSGEHLLNLIEDIFQMSLIESNGVVIKNEVFLIENMNNNIIKFIKYERNVRKKDVVDIVTNIPDELKNLYIETDQNKLKYVLFTLLRNAIKFTEKGSIEYGYKFYDDENLIFYVKDTGIGIPHKKKNVIFERFRQADDTDSRGYGGLGIGLSITKSLVEKLGGKLWFESKVGEGSTFSFTIPYKKSLGTQTSLGKESYNLEKLTLNDKTILIAEDEESNFLFLDEILKKIGIKTIWAVNGKEAIELCKKNKQINMILMDVKMPVIDGLTASKEIKKIRPGLPILALTAYALPEYKEKSSMLGLDDWIDKPVDRKKLVQLIIKYLVN